MALALSGLVGYLFGSIPFGVLLARVVGGPDPRRIGSGNIGATNVLRTGNRALAAATLLGDMFKGTAAVLLARHAAGHEAALAAALGAFLGHLFPVWLGFAGGKGVATYVGVLIGLAWPVALVFAVVWLCVAWLFRYSSLAALTASALAPAALLLIEGRDTALLGLVLSALIWIMHRANIRRLLAGKETKIDLRSPPRL